MSQPCPSFVADRQPAYSPTCMGLDASVTRAVRLSLAKEDVHVWFASVHDMIPRFGSFFATLAADEIEKAGRFHFQRDRDQYVLARGLLREILSRYGGIHPRDLRFCYGPHGKPALTTERGDERLSFNLAHAHGVLVYVVARGREVGVDLEYVDGDIDDRELATLCSSPREASLLGLLRSNSRQRAFWTCWTRKEAYAKATGEGLSLDLHSFDVLGQGDSVPRLRIDSDPSEAARWSLADLGTPAGYVAALAIEGDTYRLRYGQWIC